MKKRAYQLETALEYIAHTAMKATRKAIPPITKQNLAIAIANTIGNRPDAGQILAMLIEAEHQAAQALDIPPWD